MIASINQPVSPRKQWAWFGATVICLAVILAALFHKCFQKDIIAFSNDGPLGIQITKCSALPSAFRGIWWDLYWIGSNGTHAPASPIFLFLWLLGPVGYSKFSEPLSLLFLGICAWFFFRSLRLHPALSLVAAIAAALNSNFFSNACWGLGSRSITLGCAFLALAALNARRIGKPWLNAILAGLAVGMGVVEGADNGVIFSLYVAAFVFFQSFVEGNSSMQRLTKSLRLQLSGVCRPKKHSE
jgi:hypothetical protein